MELRKTVKKIAALGMGASMLGATIVGAMAAGNLADFPTKFVNADGKFDGLFVVGKNARAEDIIGLSSIQTAVQGVAVKKTPKNAAKAGEKTTAVDVPGGYEMGRSDFYYNKTATQVDSILGSNELPAILADQTFHDNDGNNKNTEDYTQNLRFQNENSFQLQFAQDDQTAPKAGTYVYFSDSSNNYAWNYTLEFNNAIDFDNSTSALMKSDLQGNTLKIMGKSYTIVDSKMAGTPTNTVSGVDMLKLLGGENVQWLSQGEAVKTTVEGTEHTVSLADVNEAATSCGMLVDGQSVWVDTGSTETVNGVVVGAIEARVLHSESKDTDVCKVSVGAATIELRNQAEIKLNDKKLTDEKGWYAEAYFPGASGGATAKGKLKGFHVRARPDTDRLYLAPGDSLVDPVFGGFKVVFSELVKGDTEAVSLTAGGKTGTLEFTNREGRKVKLAMKSQDNDARVYWGDDLATVDGKIYFQGDACVAATTSNISDCKGAEFLVSSSSNNDAHLIKISKLSLTDNKISFNDLTTGVETNDLAFTTSTGGASNSFALSSGAGTITLNMTANGATRSSILFSALGSGYSSNGQYVQMQTREKGLITLYNLNQGDVSAGDPSNASVFYYNGTMVSSVLTSGIDPGMGNFTEYNDGTLASTAYMINANAFRFNASFDTSSDKAIEFSHTFPTSTLPTAGAVGFGKKAVSDSDSDNQKYISAKGTEFWLDDDSSKQKIVVTHPRSAVYAKVFVAPGTAATSVVEGGEFTTEMQPIGVDQTKLDSEVTDAKSKNIIAVGGPCANAVVAELMGNPEVCDTALGIEVGQAVIKMYDNNGKMALVVAGQTADDTRLAAKMLNEYKKYALKGDEVVALTVSESTLAWKTRTELTVDKAKAVAPVAPVTTTTTTTTTTA